MWEAVRATDSAYVRTRTGGTPVKPHQAASAVSRCRSSKLGSLEAPLGSTGGANDLYRWPVGVSVTTVCVRHSPGGGAASGLARQPGSSLVWLPRTQSPWPL